MRWLVLIFAMLFAQSAPAQTGREQSADWHSRYDGFRFLFQEQRLRAADDLEELLTRPSNSVIVLMGDLRNITRNEWLRLRRYVAQGGSLLVATEDAATIPGVTSIYPGYFISDRKSQQYSGFEDCLQIPVEPGESELSKGVRELIVNRSGWMRPIDDSSLNWSVVLTVPPNCNPAVARNKLVIAAGVDPQSDGVMVLCADKSLYSDGMLWHGENSVLAINTVDLLCRGSRTSFGFFEDGLPSRGQWPPPQFRPPELPRMPPIPNRVPPVRPPEEELDLNTLVKATNLMIDELQQSDAVNEILRDRPRNMRQVAYLRTLLLILGMIVVGWFLWRIFQQRLPKVPERQHRFMESMYGVVSASQVTKGELGPAAEILARSYCRELTGAESEREWVKMTASVPEIAALPRKLRARLLDLVRIATRAAARHMSKKEFQTLGQTIVELRARGFRVESLFEISPRTETATAVR